MKLTDELYALDEPWRSRFLTLIASIAAGHGHSGRIPDRRQVTTWLRQDVALQQQVRQMLKTWGGRPR